MREVKATVKELVAWLKIRHRTFLGGTLICRQNGVLGRKEKDAA